MKFKKDIEKLLFDLKNQNVDRAKIEKDMHYSENYIDQLLSKGGNKKFYLNLKSYAERILQKTTNGKIAETITLEDGRTIAQFLKVIQQHTEIILNQSQTIKNLTEPPNLSNAKNV